MEVLQSMGRGYLARLYRDKLRVEREAQRKAQRKAKAKGTSSPMTVTEYGKCSSPSASP